MRRLILVTLLLAACGGEQAIPEANEAANKTDTAPSPAETEAPSWYENARFNFAVQVPAGFEADTAPRNADGRVFTDPQTGVELRVSGSHNAMNRSFEEQIEAARDGLDNSQSDISGNYAFRATGTDGEGWRVHLLLVRPSDGRLITALFRYPPERAERMAPVAERTLDSLRATQQVGPLSLRWDPMKLAQTDAEIGIPPNWEREVRGMKLVARGRIDLIGKAECMYGLSGEASLCTADKEAGLAFALLDQPYEQISARLTEPAPEPVTLAGRQGISWEIGAEGEGADYLLLPADGRTLLIVRHYRASGQIDEEALQAVLNSLSFEG